MMTFPNSPRLLKRGIVLIDPESGVRHPACWVDGGVDQTQCGRLVR